MAARRALSQTEAALTHGWRSGLEEAIGAQLASVGADYLYEQVSVPFLVEEARSYTPDYILRNGIIVESKGRFLTSDRKKHRLVKAQHPGLDLRFVFSNSRSRISKQSKTTYGVWAASQGFQYADRLIPSAWISEPANKVSQDAILRLLAEKNPERVAVVLKLFRRKKAP